MIGNVFLFANIIDLDNIPFSFEENLMLINKFL